MDWESLQSACMQCTRCELYQTRTNVVFGVGPKDAEVLFVGEGPVNRRISAVSRSWDPPDNCWMICSLSLV